MSGGVASGTETADHPAEVRDVFKSPVPARLRAVWLPKVVD